MARAYSLDLRERVVSAVAGGLCCRSGGQDVHGQLRQCCDVVAAPARRRQPCGAADGRPQAFTARRGRADWVLARIGAKPDLTLHESAQGVWPGAA